MYVNERDQINYHGFLRALREMNGVSQDAVAKGVCTVSGMNRFENGNRNAEKLMRDRLTSRLGISGEKYEDYLQPKEFVRWEQRLRIVKAIEDKKFKKAKQELESYEALDKLNRLNIQFIQTMRFILMSQDGASNEELLTCIKSAIKRTVPNIKEALEGEHLLADQEVNLIAEYMRLSPPPKVISSEKEWRVLEYEKLISYIENSQWEKLLKAKVYPKIAYLICQTLLEKEPSEAELRRGLELCHNAIELLRDCSRLYYFIELTETRRALATRLLNCEISSEEKYALEEMLAENNQWEQVFKELYAEYEVSAYMSDFCYLYYENESHNVVEVIENRRTMLGISRVKLSDGICTDKTIIRFEREGANPSIEVVRCLFERLGMCAEYRRTRVVTNDVNALMLSMQAAEKLNDYKLEECRQCINDLKQLLQMNIIHNVQQIKRYEAILDYKQNKTDKAEFYKKMIDALESTLPIESLKGSTKKYLTRNELLFVFDFAFKFNVEISEKCLELMECACEEITNDGEVKVSYLSEYGLFTSHLVSFWGNIGKYEKSDRISNRMLKECLAYRRTLHIPDFLYNILWNSQGRRKSIVNQKEKMEMCLSISKLLKRDSRVAFFQSKL